MADTRSICVNRRCPALGRSVTPSTGRCDTCSGALADHPMNGSPMATVDVDPVVLRSLSSSTNPA